MNTRHLTLLMFLACVMVGCEAPEGRQCLGASQESPAADQYSPREKCTRFQSERLPQSVLSIFKHGARFETQSSGQVVVRVPEGDYLWIITELGFDASVDKPGLPATVGRLFWRGYLEPPNEHIMLSTPRWRIGTLSGIDNDMDQAIPDDLWKITRIDDRGIYVGDRSRLERWWRDR